MTSQPGGSQVRARAARVLVSVIYNRNTTDQSFGRETSPMLQELVLGTLRYYHLLEPVIASKFDRDFRSKDLDLRCLLLVGAYQLFYMRIPDHAAVNETVKACVALRKPWARSMVNAVLRKTAAEPAPIPSEHSFGLPQWMTERIEASYPDRAREIMATTLDRAPMSLRVNVARISPADYATLLDQAGITAAPAWHPENLVLDSPRPVAELPGYADGLVSVQDSGALFACSLLQDAKQVLDACAAPGGKLFHLAEQLPEARLTALEKSPPRLEHLRSEAARLGHESVVLVQGDATTTDWHEGGSFDAILLDAPCSGSGTLRRHPDIKVLRQASDLPRYAALQRRLLDNLWRLLAPGGTLVYCTCSLFPEENDQVVKGFLEATGDVNLATLSLPIGVPTRHGWQLLPLPDAAVDGFYYARMIRSVEAHPAMRSQRERGQAP